MSPGHLFSFLDKTFCMEPILHCIFKPSRVKFRTFIFISLHGNIKISFSKFVHNSCPEKGGGGGAMMGIDLESHVTEIDAWMMIASGHF